MIRIFTFYLPSLNQSAQKEDNNTMIIMIGGSSHVGKTLIAQKLIEKFRFPCISLDYLKTAFINCGITTLTCNDDYKMRYWMWPFVREIIKSAVDKNQNLILEGCYIPENWKDGLDTKYLNEIHCVFIVMSHCYLKNHFEDIKAFSGIIEKREPEENLDLDRLIHCSEAFKQDCISNKTPYIEIEKRFDIDVLFEQVLLLLKQN